jgi:hypothetical protein
MLCNEQTQNISGTQQQTSIQLSDLWGSVVRWLWSELAVAGEVGVAQRSAQWTLSGLAPACSQGSSKGAREQVETHIASSGLTWVTTAIILLTKGRHTAKLRLKGWGNRFHLLSGRNCKDTSIRHAFIKKMIAIMLSYYIDLEGCDLGKPLVILSPMGRQHVWEWNQA